MRSYNLYDALIYIHLRVHEKYIVDAHAQFSISYAPITPDAQFVWLVIVSVVVVVVSELQYTY